MKLRNHRPNYKQFAYSTLAAALFSAVAVGGQAASFFLFRHHALLKQEMLNFNQKALLPLWGWSFASSLLDGLSIREELVLKSLNDSLSNIPLVGGSAGDDMFFKDNQVFSVSPCTGTFRPIPIWKKAHRQGSTLKSARRLPSS